MSLRLRLALLNISQVGGVILIFGALVYGAISTVLLNQVDQILIRSANQIISQIKVNNRNQFDPRTIITLQTSEDIIFQVWGQDKQLQLARPINFQTPLDEIGRLSGTLTINSTNFNDLHLRVLSVPLQSSRGPAGVLQIAYNLAFLDITLRTLATVLIMLSFLVTFIAGGIAWIITGRTLAPLETATQIATTITKVDDLSRRIPVYTTSDDEVGRLIQAFNETLQRLENLFASQQRFVADVSHEFRTPLTVIKGNIGLIRKMGEADPESLNSIETEIDRLTRLVGDLLFLARAESGRMSFHLSPLEFDSLVFEVFREMRLLAGDKLTLHLAEIDQIMVNGDHDRLKQVLINLISNAIQYTPPGGTVTVALKKSNSHARLSVTDTGPGIPQEEIQHIYDRFYRGEKSRKRGQGIGFGLGLSIAYLIVDNHGGTLDVTTAEGEGTTFCVCLPIYTTDN